MAISAYQAKCRLPVIKVALVVRRPIKPSPAPQHAILTADQMRLAIARLERRISDLNAFDVEAINDSNDPKLSALESSIDDTLAKTFGSDTVEYARYRNARALERSPAGWNRIVISGARRRCDS